MNHATIKLGDYTIPLIGIAQKETQEKCDRCGKTFSIQEVKIVVGQFLCKGCHVERIRIQLRSGEESQLPDWYKPRTKKT